LQAHIVGLNLAGAFNGLYLRFYGLYFRDYWFGLTLGGQRLFQRRSGVYRAFCDRFTGRLGFAPV
jgi:hypothetical protein